MSPPPPATTTTTTTFTTIPTTTRPTTLTFFTRATTQPHLLLTSHLRPWRLLLSLSSLSFPSGYSDATFRLRRNLVFFRYNYALIILLVLFLGLIFHPVSMIVFLVLFVLWVFLYFDRVGNVRVMGREIGDGVVLGVLGVVTAAAVAATGVGVNVLVGLVVGVGVVGVVGVHGMIRGVDDLYADEEEGMGGGGLVRP